MDGSNGSMTRYADSIDLLQVMKRHDDSADPFHFKMHQVVSLGAQFQGGVTYMGLTTTHMLLNLGRAIQSGGKYNFKLMVISISVIVNSGFFLLVLTHSMQKSDK